MTTLKDLFELDSSRHRELFAGLAYPWEVVARLNDYLQSQKSVASRQYPGAFVGPGVTIGDNTTVEPGAVIYGPAIIGRDCQIRSGAYIRGNVIIEDGVRIGHASEIKNSLILSGAQVPHFNYVGDSIVGRNSHLAAGVILSNSKISQDEVVVHGEQDQPTGLKKFGAAVGDNAEVGCNAVLNPGSIIGKNSVIYPLVSWRGVLPPNKIAKTADNIVDRK